MGTVWRLCEYKGVNEGNILPSTPLTHTLRDPRGRSPHVMVNQVYYWGQLQDNVEGYLHPLSCRSEGTLQHSDRGNYSITGNSLPCTTPSGCQLNHICHQQGTHQLHAAERLPNK